MKAKELAEILMKCPDANVFIKEWVNIFDYQHSEVMKEWIVVEPLWNSVVIDVRD